MGINLVIIAAIALLVLVIIGMIVIGRGQDFSEGTQGCLADGGRCVDQTVAYDGDYEILTEHADECEPQVCARYDYG